MSQDIYVVIEHLRAHVADISYVMLAASRVLAQSTGGNVVAVLLGHNAQDLSSDFNADRVLYFDHPSLTDFTSDAYQKVLSNLIQEDQPRAVLFGNTSIGSDVASVISARLGLPIITSCKQFTAAGGYLSQICGGKIMVEGDLPEPTALLTIIPGGYKPEEGKKAQQPEISEMQVGDLDELKVSLVGYIEPDTSDVDISKEPILVSIGRGIQAQDNVELAEELAEALGGFVCASRPVVDQGWLPTSRLIGKSGKNVKPKLYLAFGISGAPEHIESITESETIIAVNTDPSAPIFDIAKYGAEFDLFDLIEVLTEKVREAKSG